MELKKTMANQQPARLHLSGQPPLECAIEEITPSGLSISLTSSYSKQILSENVPGELHVENFSGIKVEASRSANNANKMQLTFIKAQDANVRQLVNWFSNARSAPASPHNSAYTRPSDAAIISELSEISLKQTANLFDIFLQQADSQLLTMAEEAINNEQQNKLFEIKAVIFQQGDNIAQYYRQELNNRIQNDIANNTSDKQTLAATDAEDIALIDIEAFEDWLSLATIIRRADEQYFKPQACLTQRYGELLGHKVNSDNLPVSISNICLALQDTLKHHRFTAELLPVIYRIFDETVINHLANLFDTLNNKLKSYGILPDIEADILKKTVQVKTAVTSNAPAGDPSQTDQETGHGAIAQGNPTLLNAARNILGRLRKPATDLLESTAPPTHSTDVIEQLSELQHSDKAINALIQGDSLVEWLNKHSDLNLSNDDTDLIALVDAIFQNIKQYPQIPAPLAAQMRRLEVPIAKTALLDANFFSSPEHPATALLNQLIDLCLNSDMPNQALEKKLDKVITDVSNSYQQDPSVFDKALDELTPIASHQRNAYQRNTDRIAQTYDGRQRVQHAQDAVEQEIQQRLNGPQAPEVIIELIENGWHELLKLTYIRLGPESDHWKQHLQTLDQLLMWLSETGTDDSSSQSTIERELEADSFADLIGQQLNNAFPGDYRYQSTVEKIRDTLNGSQPIIMVASKRDTHTATGTPNKLQKELEAANPQLNRWFKRAKSLEVGDEFSYLNDENGQRNIKLAWVSDNKQHYVFVNNRGQKVLDFDLVDLANELAKGLSPVTEKSEWPLVERSLYSTVQEAYAKLAFNSSHDELTGVISRKECERLLGNALIDAKNNSQNHCLLYFDIDKFSLTNNLHGHVAGDQLLIDISHLLQQNIPEDSMIARMAGNEFVILLQHTDSQQGKAIANTIRNEVENHTFHWQQHPIKFTISAGLIMITKYTESVVDLLRNALSACQTAKKTGGNRVHEFRQDAELHQRREKLLSWIDKLNDVLSGDRMVLRGQKISPLEDIASSSHYEILLAIKDENGELTSPVEFIEAAECYNRMQRVDRWVIENTFQWLDSLHQSDIPLPAVSINLSGNSINDDHFLDFILEQFDDYKIPSEKICFEVTETATINNLSEAADFIREIKKVGCKFSLDDFGSGNASYQYLKHLPVDYLKIDGMFVQEIDKNKNDYALVTSINDIAHLMGKKTIAEYAESNDILDILREIGVDYGQGYAISRPTPLTKITTLIKPA